MTEELLLHFRSEFLEILKGTKMELLGLCQLCKTCEGLFFDENEKWICEACEYKSSYSEFDYEDEYESSDIF